MTYTVRVAEGAEKRVQKWLNSHPQLQLKYRSLTKELEAHPRTGTGKPEPLRGGRGILWSRRIDKENRILYEIRDDIVLVIVVKVGGHYDDK